MVLIEENRILGVEIHQLLCGKEIAIDDDPLHFVAGEMANYVYIIADVASRQACLIDPAWDIVGCNEYVKKLGLNVKHALFTHGHFDHVGGSIPHAMIGSAIDVSLPGLRELADQCVSCYVGARDVDSVVKQTGVSVSQICPVNDMDTVSITPVLNFTVMATPGHTPGSVCFKIGDILFTGDTLFIGSCGRIDLPESNAQEMFESLARLSDLPEQTLVLPGHNYAPETFSTIMKERSSNGMMTQAVAQHRTSINRNRRVNMKPVCSTVPLPDYLCAVRRALEERNCRRDNEEPPFIARHLFSHF